MRIYLEAAAGVTAFILAGRYAQARAKRRSGDALRALLQLGAKDVAVLRGRRRVLIPVESLAVGDRFVARPGEKIATDGEVVERQRPRSTRSMLTGESVPVEVGPGDTVAGGTVNAGGRLVVRATRSARTPSWRSSPGWSSTPRPAKAAVQRLADRISAVFVPVVLGWRARSVARLVVARGRGVAGRGCGADDRLPVRRGTGDANRADGRHRTRGTARDRDRAPRCWSRPGVRTRFVLDKTGTVTSGRMTLSRRRPGHRRERGRTLLLRRAAASRGRLRAPDRAAPSPPAARDRVGDLPAGDGVHRNPRASACRASSTAATSSPAAPAAGRAVGLPLDARAAGRAATVAEAGRSHRDRRGLGRRRPRGPASSPTPSSPPARGRSPSCAELGLRPVLLTGDNERAARTVAGEVGIGEVIAEVLPGQKVDGCGSSGVTVPVGGRDLGDG